ncbi:AMP-binding enzyme family protein [Mycobacterium kansasii]|uniref:AMP-binding enzyme family protein n=1 Tax=Mycobacterium kansasii TaxID=1768 RepID=A0A1V3X6E7_MYCKA|nr:AMP-binding enzyme family protein [Mycobacterium kansasii]
MAICLPRSWQLVCVMLGIRRAGATVVPLDADSPVTRQHHILADSGSVAVVCATPETAPTPASVRALRVADLLDAGPGPLTESTHRRRTRVSSSTPRERPDYPRASKSATPAYCGWPSRDGCASTRHAGCQHVQPAFDALTFEVWTPLLTGGTCVVFGGLGLNGSTGLNGQAHLQTRGGWPRLCGGRASTPCS